MSCKPINSSPQRRGFSLVEVIAVIVILGIIGGVSSSLILTNVASFTESSVRIQLHGEASVTLDRIVREVREIDPDPTVGPPRPHIRQARANSLQWDDSCSLGLVDGTLLLNTDGVHEDVLCGDVSEFSLDYLDESNHSLLIGGAVPPSDLPRIRRVAIHLSLQRQGMTESLSTRVFIRAAMTGGMP